jgi:excisionase family DNA binding protein
MPTPRSSNRPQAPRRAVAVLGRTAPRHAATAVRAHGCLHARRRRRLSERLLNAAEVAELLALPESWVREHTRNGSMPRIQLGRYIRYRREAVLGWIDSLESNRGRASNVKARGQQAREAA